jgi:hypothetical protein
MKPYTLLATCVLATDTTAVAYCTTENYSTAYYSTVQIDKRLLLYAYYSCSIQ